MKTIIELFDECPINNAIAVLKFKPEKVIFIGFKKMMSKDTIKDLENFFDMNGIRTKIECEIVGRFDFDPIVEKINRIIDTNEDCAFDLTGGKEVVLAAMGYVSCEHKIPMFQFNVETDEFEPLKNCQNITEPEKTSTNIKEIVALNGGAVVEKDDDFEWVFDSEFKKDLENLWEFNRNNYGLWNKQSTEIAGWEKKSCLGEDLSIRVNFKPSKSHGNEPFIHNKVFDYLKDNGLISEYVYEDDVLSYRYKNEQIHRLITKAGNVLELIAYMLLQEISEENGSYYADIAHSVSIDWDGEDADLTTLNRDTTNEVDLILIRNMVPVFISCKNGEVHKEALYELETIAERFGGEYVKKILLATYVNHDCEKHNYLKQRAADMKIDVIHSLYNYDRDGLKDLLKLRIK